MGTLAYMRGYETKRIPFGFSWTTFIFGFWPSVFRAHWSFALIHITMMTFAWFVSIILFQGGDAALFVIGVHIVLASVRNGMLRDFVIANGWRLGNRAPVIPINVASNH